MSGHRALRWLLWPASLVFHAAVRVRAWCYRRGIFRQQRLGGVVISVGNLTVGGTGKTPMVLWIAQRLLAEKKRVGILTRGYRAAGPEGFGAGRRDERGIIRSDEVAVLRGRLGARVRFGIGADRYAKGRALERHGVAWFILDDGFQHLRLTRDVDMVLLDATDPFGSAQGRPFGGELLLPAGRLREPMSAVARADIVVITRAEHAPAVVTLVRRYTPAPVFYATMELEGVVAVTGKEVACPAADWQSRPFFAFCGIGNPAAFFADLRRWGFQIVSRLTFRDHHVYTQRDADEIERRARAAGAQALVCTEKDGANLRAARFSQLPIYYCKVSLYSAQAEDLWQTILSLAERKRAPLGSGVAP